MATITPPLKWHGGKHYLAKRIIALMPRHLHYVEPYAGGLAVLLARDPENPALMWSDRSSERGVSEVVNDIDGELMNFWESLRQCGPQMVEDLRITPFSERRWEYEQRNPYTPIDSPDWRAAVSFFIRCRQSRQGLQKDFATVSRNRTRRGMNEQVSAWLTAIEGLPEVHARLKRVLILNRPALEVIRTQDGPKTLFYLDPPYLHQTRTVTTAYQYEMSKDDHFHLLTRLGGIAGNFLLSGYRSPLYDGAAKSEGWHRVDFDLPNNAGGGKTKRRMTECVWMNFEPEKTE